jgi:hypothetical protein
VDWNFDEIGTKLNKIAEGMPTIFADMKVIIANDVKAKHRQRLDAGQPRKSYKSEAYKKFRAAQGRQTGYIDMQLSGEFVRSLTIGKEGDDVVYGVADRRDGKTTTSTIYKGQVERNNHGDLVQINSDDTTRGIEAANRYFTDKIRELFNQV